MFKNGERLGTSFQRPYPYLVNEPRDMCVCCVCVICARKFALRNATWRTKGEHVLRCSERNNRCCSFCDHDSICRRVGFCRNTR